MIEIYTDGSSLNNQSKGKRLAGCAFAVVLNNCATASDAKTQAMEIAGKQSLQTLIYSYKKHLGAVTNNAAELYAVLFSLKWLRKNITQVINTALQSQITDTSLQITNALNIVYNIDSKYVIGVVTGNYKAKANIKLLEIIYELLHEINVNAAERNATITISFKHVKGHNGNEFNELVDKLAKEAALTQ